MGPLVKPFRALRYDTEVAGPLDDLIAPPYDVISPDALERLANQNQYNVIRLIRPHEYELAAERLADWQTSRILVREPRPALWRIEEEYTGPDGVGRIRQGIVARVRVEPYENGIVLPHERIFPGPTETRLELLRATRTKLSPVFLLHDGGPPVPAERHPDLQATLGGTTARLWRIDDPLSIAEEVGRVEGPLVIADGHHRYDAALRFHLEEKSEETGYVMAVLVSRDDPGLTIFPTHRLVGGSVPRLNGDFALSHAGSSAEEGLAALQRVARDHPAFVCVEPSKATLVERRATVGALLDRLDVSVVDGLPLERVTYTSSVREAGEAVTSGRVSAALLVRAPTVDEVETIARASEVMPEKSTYFYPKLISGLLFSPFDE
jgi:uncharacterized protein (DUF1015 family)